MRGLWMAWVGSLAVGVGCGALGAGAAAQEGARMLEPLTEYVAKKDDAFAWKTRRSGTIGTCKYVELTLVSQKWRDIVWKHQLYILKPTSCPADAKHGLLYITGGNWRPDLEVKPPEGSPTPGEGPIFALLAERLRSPVAVLLQVPHQPIFDGKTEDAIISYTFEQYLRTGENDWPLLLPMVKSAVRGMDATQAYCKDEWKLDLKSFTVTGASKRGWTTWLTGAVDARATVLAPMVIDVLNMEKHLDLQLSSWGDFSEMIHDYTDRGLQKNLRTPRGQSLLTIVDPHHYRHRFTQPKLIVLGTNDMYWPLESLNLYWSDLPDQKYILYVPNNGHGINDYLRMTGSIAALHRQATEGLRLPKLEWKFDERADRVTLAVTSDLAPSRARMWKASSASRDFRKAAWSSTSLAPGDGKFACDCERPKEGFSAMFAEVQFDDSQLPYYFSTNVRVVEGDGAASGK